MEKQTVKYQKLDPRAQAPDWHKRSNGMHVTLDKRKSSAAA